MEVMLVIVTMARTGQWSIGWVDFRNLGGKLEARSSEDCGGVARSEEEGGADVLKGQEGEEAKVGIFFFWLTLVLGISAHERGSFLGIEHLLLFL